MTLADAGVVLKLVEASKCQRQGATYTELVRSCYDCRCLPGSGGVVGTAATKLTSDVPFSTVPTVNIDASIETASTSATASTVSVASTSIYTTEPASTDSTETAAVTALSTHAASETSVDTSSETSIDTSSQISSSAASTTLSTSTPPIPSFAKGLKMYKERKTC